LMRRASRRLQLCAEETGAIGIALLAPADHRDLAQPTAAMAPMDGVPVMPTTPLPVPCVGRHHRLVTVTLIRSRARNG
jgi:protein ImuA